MRFRVVSITLLLLVAIGFAAAMPWLPSLLQSRDFYGLQIQKDAPDFVIGDSQLSELQGRFVYLLFGYLRCGDVCHRQVANMLALNQSIQSQPVSFVFVSLDPERDGTELLQGYFNSQGPHFHSARPTNERQAHRIANLYNEYFVKSGDGEDYEIDHSGFMYLIDPKGQLRLIYTSSKLNVEAMLNDLKQLQKN